MTCNLLSCVLSSRRRSSCRNQNSRRWRKNEMSWDSTQIDWRAGWVPSPLPMHAGRLVFGNCGGVTLLKFLSLLRFDLSLVLELWPVLCSFALHSVLFLCLCPDRRVVGRARWWEKHQWVSISVIGDWDFRKTPPGEGHEGFAST